MKQYIKKIWKLLPPSWHENALRLLCRMKLAQRRNTQRNCEHATSIYVVGCFQAGGGLSRSAHLYAEKLRKKGLDVICVDSTHIALQTVKNPMPDGSLITIATAQQDTGYATVILHHNPPQIQIVLCALGKNFLAKKYITAYWAWELENIPPLWIDAINYIDAIEVPSTFTQQAMLRHTKKPVQVVPHELPAPLKTKSTYCEGGKLACLFVMDMGSLRLRKNPEAVICAFTQAFSPSEAILTIKLGQIEAFKDDYTAIAKAAQGYEHVRLLTHWMDDTAMEKLYLDNDVYISLHRSEGYGLTIQEAMLRNLYIVATGWSGNMDFMQGEKVFAVPYSLVPIQKTHTALDRVENARWADADITATAEILQKLRRKLLDIDI